MSSRISNTVASVAGRRTLLVAAIAAIAIAIACRDVVQPPMSRNLRASDRRRSTVILPDSMHGWVFYDDQHDTLCTVTSVCGFVQGPATGPLGSGSAELATPGATDGKALLLAAYGGTRFDSITDLHYSTYRQSADPGNNLAISLQFNVDYDLTDAATSYMGRIVFEPYQGVGGNVPQNTWQTWDAKAGKWWGTKSTVTKAGAPVTNPCVQATPCTWTQLLSAFPNIGVHTTLGAVVLKAGSNWAGFRGNVDAFTLGISGTTTTYDFELTATPAVPALPPNSVPTWVFADSNIIDGGDVLAGQLAKNAIVVGFEVGTSIADRQAALAKVGGIVIGGVPTDTADGFYYVRPQNGATAADIMAAADSVNSMPGVVLSIPALVDSVVEDYRRPFDGPSARDWRLNPDSTDGDTWALERIAAPWAWGCSTGSIETRVGIVDGPFQAVPDLTRNVQGNPSYTSSPERHGTAVASIVGAKGNDSIGSTGVMWDADLRLYDRSPSILETLFFRSALQTDMRRLISAVKDGARVINLSGHVGFPLPNTPAGRARAAVEVRALRSVLRLKNGDPTAPLFVFSAGNARVDAWRNGYPGIEAEYPSRVLVVAAASQTNQKNGDLVFTSNFGDLVQIAAPGQHLLALDQTGNAVATFGATSGAAAYVTGVAGLLLSFDPALSVSQVRDLIVAGAVVGGRTAAGIPLLNAYESLKLAAQRNGAPLCGNRVWVDGNTVKVQRSSTNETIVSGGISGSAFLSTYHGGKRFDLDYSRDFEWVGGNWLELPYISVPDAEQNGAFWSYNQADHDDKQFVFGVLRRDTAVAGTDTVIVTFTDSLGSRRQFRRTFPVIRQLASTCVADTVHTVPNSAPPVYISNMCSNFQRLGSWDDFETVGGSGCGLSCPNGDPLFTVLAPQADFILVPLATMHHVVSDGPVVNCDRFAIMPPGVHDHCHNGSFSDSSMSLVIYKISLSDGSWTPIALAPGTTTRDRGYFEWLEVSESGDQLVIGAGEHVRSGSDLFDIFGGASRVATTFLCTNGRDEWLSLASSSGRLPGTPLFSVQRPSPEPCDGSVEGGSTVNSRRPSRPPILAPANSHGAPKPTTRARPH